MIRQHLALDDTFKRWEEKEVPLHTAAQKFMTTVPGTFVNKVKNPINLMRF
jgi:hypothetical protein